MASRSLTSMRTMSVASLSAAAWPATRASSVASSVAVMLRPSLRAVETVLVDVLHDTVRDEVPDRLPGGDPAAAVTGGDGHGRDVEQRHGVSRQVVDAEVVARSGHADEPGPAQRLLRVLPRQNLAERIGPGDEEQLRARPLLLDVADRVD